MKASPLLRIGAVLGLIAGVWALRQATMSTHYETGPDSRLRVVIQSSHNRSEPSQTLERLTTAHVALCGLEVEAERERALEPVAGHDGRFVIVLRPALDSSDRKQYRGCLEDWVVDHHRIEVVSMTYEERPE